jgi:methylenetetrahydrofolate dehydrogenase (NADP+)/methenyltetrahydrofolate cyclohydrolase
MTFDGNEVAGYIQERQAGQIRRLKSVPVLAIVRQGSSPATNIYLKVKKTYGEELGVDVRCYTETPDTLLKRIHELNRDPAITGINVELPFEDAPELTDDALAAVALAKDVDGLAPNSPYDPATPKAIWWLLSAYNIELKAKIIAVVGQGRLVGSPLSDQFETAGYTVIRIDDTVDNLAHSLITADVIISGTGVPGLITSDMAKPGAVIIDAGAPRSDLAADLRTRTDIKCSPNPGGVGPVTVAALYENLLIAAGV